MNIPVILASIGVCLYTINLFICITMITLIFLRLRPSKSHVSILLTCNTYFNALLVSSIMLLMYFYNLLGNLNTPIVFNGRWCEIRTYITHVCFCAFYHSFVLQAIFRLFRIVFYKHRFLQSYGVFLASILLQWILSFSFLLPNFLLNDFQYRTEEFNCWIAFQNIRGLIMVTLIIYNNPLTVIFTIYTQIIRYTHRMVQVQQRRLKSNQRDLIILKRIVILVFVIVGIGLPTVIIVFIYIVTKSIVPFAYHIQGLSISLGVLVGSVSLIFVNPQIQKVFSKNHAQIRPQRTATAQANRPEMPTVNT